MIKKRLAIADQYLPEIQFLVEKPDRCSLELIASGFYWVDANGYESSLSVSHKVMSSLVSNGVLVAYPSKQMSLATPVYLLAVGCDPREHLTNLEIPIASEYKILEFAGHMIAGRNFGAWSGYTVAW